MSKSMNMLRTRRRDNNVKPNRRLDRKSSRGMIYENEELRLKTININAEVERGQSDIKKLRRENEMLKKEIWYLRDEYEKLDKLLKQKEDFTSSSSSTCSSDSEASLSEDPKEVETSQNLENVQKTNLKNLQAEFDHLSVVPEEPSTENSDKSRTSIHDVGVDLEETGVPGLPPDQSVLQPDQGYPDFPMTKHFFAPLPQRPLTPPQIPHFYTFRNDTIPTNQGPGIANTPGIYTPARNSSPRPGKHSGSSCSVQEPQKPDIIVKTDNRNFTHFGGLDPSMTHLGAISKLDPMQMLEVEHFEQKAIQEGYQYQGYQSIHQGFNGNPTSSFPRSSFSNGGNLEELLNDIQTISEDILKISNPNMQQTLQPVQEGFNGFGNNLISGHYPLERSSFNGNVQSLDRLTEEGLTESGHTETVDSEEWESGLACSQGLPCPPRSPKSPGLPGISGLPGPPRSPGKTKKDFLEKDNNKDKEREALDKYKSEISVVLMPTPMPLLGFEKYQNLSSDKINYLPGTPGIKIPEFFQDTPGNHLGFAESGSEGLGVPGTFSRVQSRLDLSNSSDQLTDVDVNPKLTNKHLVSDDDKDTKDISSIKDSPKEKQKSEKLSIRRKVSIHFKGRKDKDKNDDTKSSKDLKDNKDSKDAKDKNSGTKKLRPPILTIPPNDTPDLQIHQTPQTAPASITIPSACIQSSSTIGLGLSLGLPASSTIPLCTTPLPSTDAINQNITPHLSVVKDSSDSEQPLASKHNNKSTSASPERHDSGVKKHHKHKKKKKSSSGGGMGGYLKSRRNTLSTDQMHRERSLSICTDRGPYMTDDYVPSSERERTNSLSSCGTNAERNRRKFSTISKIPSATGGKIPWCACWGNGCI